MKTKEYWAGVIQDPGDEFTSFEAIAEAIQDDATTTLRTQLESKDKLIKDFCHTENEVEKSALKVLTEFQVHGDSFGVPGTNQIVDTLVSEVQSLRTRLAEVEESHRLMKEQVRVSDEAFNFHLKRANELMEKCNRLEAEAVVMCQRLEASIKCGKSALLKLNEAENLLRETVTPPGNIGQVKIPPLWISRRDAFLNPTNKDVDVKPDMPEWCAVLKTELVQLRAENERLKGEVVMMRDVLKHALATIKALGEGK